MAWHLTPLDAFPDFAADWDRLNRRAGGSPLLATDFVIPLLAEFGRDGDLLARLEEGVETAALAVVRRSGRLGWQTLQPANAPLGLWLAAPGRPLADLAKGLLSALPGLPLMLGISQQDPALTERPADADGTGTLDYITTPYLTVRGSFDDYWAARGKNLRHNIKRQSNRLAREGVTPRLEVLDRAEDMPRAIADYAALETHGWKGAARTAVTGDDPQARFYTAMMQRFCRRGEGLVYRLFYNDTLAASDICLLADGVLIILKTAYNEALTANNTSPAQLMRHLAFRSLFDGGHCRRIEFYGPLKDWHKRWTDEARTLFHVNRYRWPIVAVMHAGAATAAEGGTP